MYQDLKLTVLSLTGLSRDAVHIYIGLIVFFSFIAFFRKGKIEPAALMPVLFVALCMETVDLFDSYTALSTLNWKDSAHDLLNTIFWPAAIVLLAKFNHAFIGSGAG